MTWRAQVGDRVVALELKRGSGGEIAATVDGRPYRMTVSEPQPRVFSLLEEGGRMTEALVSVRQGRCRVRIGSSFFDIAPAELERVGGLGAKAAGQGEIRSVMPGRVLRVLVEAGQAVTARQGLVVLEAMKMENELAAPRDGTVREVRVVAGRTVEAGEILVVME